MYKKLVVTRHLNLVYNIYVVSIFEMSRDNGKVDSEELEPKTPRSPKREDGELTSSSSESDSDSDDESELSSGSGSDGPSRRARSTTSPRNVSTNSGFVRPNSPRPRDMESANFQHQEDQTRLKSYVARNEQSQFQRSSPLSSERLRYDSPRWNSFHRSQASFEDVEPYDQDRRYGRFHPYSNPVRSHSSRDVRRTGRFRRPYFREGLHRGLRQYQGDYERERDWRRTEENLLYSARRQDDHEIYGERQQRQYSNLYWFR